MAKLLLLSGDAIAREIPLAKDPFVIGRALESDLALMDHLVSRRHAKIARDPATGHYQVQDLGSANGVFVNEERLAAEEQLVKDGDRLRIGSSVLEFQGDTISLGRVRGADITVTVGATPAGDQDTAMSVVKRVDELRPEYTVTATPAGGLLGMLKDRRGGGAPGAGAGKEGLHFFILFQLAQAVNSAAAIDDVLDRALELTCEALNAGRGVLMILHKASGRLEPKVARDRRRHHGSRAGTPAAPGEAEQEIRLSHTIVDRVTKERVSVLTRDALVDPRFQAGRSVAQMQIRSAICVPLWDGDDVSGIIYLDNVQMPGAFTAEDRDLVTAVGHPLAVALKRQEMTERLKREAVIRANLERYHSPDVVEMILRQETAVGLEVREAEVTILFCDIEGFSKIAEQLEAPDVAKLLNGYFDVMSNVIFRQGGQVNKYIGDAIMAVFGAPLPAADHAATACKTALEMVAALEPYREKLPEEQRFRIRIGINTGAVVAGNIGTDRRLEYTVIGDAVNVAARLEKIAPPDEIAIGPITEMRIRGRFGTRPLGRMPLRGMGKELDVFVLERSLPASAATPTALRPVVRDLEPGAPRFGVSAPEALPNAASHPTPPGPMGPARAGDEF